MLLTFICLFLVDELKRDWYSIQTLLGLLYQNRNMQSASPQGVHACFFFLLSQTGFVWLPCVCVIFFQSGIAVIVWDFPEWRRLCFTEISTFLLFTHGKGSLAFEGNIEQFEFQILHFYCVSILTCCEYIWSFLIYLTEIFELQNINLNYNSILSELLSSPSFTIRSDEDGHHAGGKHS